MIEGMFHYKNGWHFGKKSSNEPGKVCIRRQDEKSGQLIESIYIDADSWASIVASVSACGDNADSVQIASLLHQGDFLGILAMLQKANSCSPSC